MQNCGKESHGECASLTKCANCRGPHPYNDLSYQARPKVIDGKLQKPSKRQLIHLRQLGDNSYNEAVSLLKPAAQVSQPGAGVAEQAEDHHMEETPDETPNEITLATATESTVPVIEKVIDTATTPSL